MADPGRGSAVGPGDGSQLSSASQTAVHIEGRFCDATNRRSPADETSRRRQRFPDPGPEASPTFNAGRHACDLGWGQRPSRRSIGSVEVLPE